MRPNLFLKIRQQTARYWLLVLLVCSGQTAMAQASITGPACVVAGVEYTYTIAGNWTNSTSMEWCITNGVVVSYGECRSGTPLPQVTVEFTSGYSTGAVQLTSSIGNATVNVTITPALSAGTISPLSQTINYNTTPSTITCTAASGGSCSPSYTYQWQQSSDDVNWSSISGETDTSLSFSSALTQTTYYREMVTETSSSTTTYSATATVNVNPPPSPGTISPSSYNINYNTSPGEITCSSATGGDGNYTYQWQSSSDNSTWTSISGATSNYYNPGNLTDTIYFRRAVTSIGITVYSNSCEVAVYPQLLSGIVYPDSIGIFPNSSPGELTGSIASGGNGTIAYQWQSSTDDLVWANISGATGQNYTPGDLTTTTYYQRVVTSNGITEGSNIIKVIVYASLQAGGLSPYSQTIEFGGVGIAISSNPSGGDGNYSYQWQQSANNSSWSNITGATTSSYTPLSLSNSQYYRLAITDNGSTVYSGSVIVYIPLYGGIIAINSGRISSGSADTLSSVQNAAGGNSSSYTYQYQSSADQQNWTNISGTIVSNITQTTFFRREVVDGNGSAAYSNTVRARVEAPTPSSIAPNSATSPSAGTATSITMPSTYSEMNPDDMNYIKTRDFTEPGIGDMTTADDQTSVNVVHQTTQYYDGLGRPIETVSMESSPDGHDMIATTYYDDYGRIVQQYLPYEDGGTTGDFRTDASTKQPAFYNAQFNNTEGYFYSNTTYENSPLNRVLETTAPGNSWTGNNVGISQLERTNDLYDSVRIWTIDSTEDALPATAASYNPGTLSVQVTTDENGNEVIIYKDLQGQVILKKVQINDLQLPGHYDWLCTYYVYDDLNNLRFVIPPKAVEYLQANSWILSQTIRYDLCFSYLYDERNRLIMKQVPNGGKTYMVYDTRDRMVFSQDSVQRANDQWLVNFYDGQNRPVMLALYPSSDSRATLQSDMDAVTGSTATLTYNIPAPANLVVNQRDPSITTYTADSSITFMPGFSSVDNDSFSTNIAPGSTSTTETVDVVNPLPNITGYEPLKYFYYDDYTSWQGAQSFNSSYLSKLVSGGDPYPMTDTLSNETRGQLTGTKARVLGIPGEQWLTTTTYYDYWNRPIQVFQDNIGQGTDVATTEYDFAGRPLSTYLFHDNPPSGMTVSVLTLNNYDPQGRLLSVTKTINDDPNTRRTVDSMGYNELGQLEWKELGINGSSYIDTLHYDYNIRGWLNGINKHYLTTTATTPGPGEYFGDELDYDYGFNQTQVNGNIAGIKWKSAGDQQQRAYGYNYDNANRLLKADFNQYDNGSWDLSQGIDFSTNNIVYDANGNIQSLHRNGVLLSSSQPIDELKYTYANSGYSNQLLSVSDTVTQNNELGDFYDGNTSGNDYAYDGNGNLTEDLNKGITSIQYNFLNLPDTIDVTKTTDHTNKGMIRYVYDADGTKWQKIVTDSTLTPIGRDTTTYIGGFIYKNDTLQYMAQEEGRVRPKQIDSTQGWGASNLQWIYDYYEKDHLGDVRMTLTEEKDTAYYIATMEQQNASKENRLFDNVSSTQYPTPTGFDNPTDTSNHYVSRLNASSGTGNYEIGPSIILKVMAGDQLTASVYAWYNTAVQAPDTNSLLSDLLSALGNGVIGNSSGKFQPGQLGSIETAITPAVDNFLSYKDGQYNNTLPKAFLNWALFDDQFKFVEGGVNQVQSGASKQALVASIPTIPKNGYIYIYLSNESPQDVFFDDLDIQHFTGPILEEDHYYPFGLSMAGISDQAALKPENYFKFNGKELNHKEFSDGSGLDWYSYGMREYDPQIARFFRVDPLSTKFTYLTPYQYASNDPIVNIDIDGLEGLNVNIHISQPSDATNAKAPTPTTQPPSSTNGTQLMSADQANTGYKEPPYEEGTLVKEYKMGNTQDGEYVRFFNPENKGTDATGSGRWFVKASDVAGKTPEQIKNELSLPGKPPTKFVKVNPTDQTVREGTAGKNSFGEGGGTQYEVRGDASVKVTSEPTDLPDKFVPPSSTQTDASTANTNTDENTTSPSSDQSPAETDPNVEPPVTPETPIDPVDPFVPPL
jgi:RHS repeat-associated protein